jgi:hypothetical protein
MATFYISNANPVHYVKQTPDTNAAYNSKLFDEYAFKETILPWQQPVDFVQEWQQSDTLSQQVISSIGPVTFQVVDEYNQVVYATNFEQVAENGYVADTFIYELHQDLSIFDEGEYYFRIVVGNLILRSSVPQRIAEKIEGSILCRFSNFKYFSGIVFETGFSSSIRVPGTLIYKQPSSKDTLYEDQVLNMTMLDSKQFRLWNFVIGLETGIPDYLIDTLNPILGCSTVLLDGKQYAKNEGAKFEPTAEEGYSMRTWVIELREAVNRSAKLYEQDLLLTGQNHVISVTGSKGFGTDDDSATFTIKDVE